MKRILQYLIKPFKRPTTKTDIKSVFVSEEISLFLLLRLFTERKYIFYIFIAIFLILGIVAAATQRTYHTSKTTIISEVQVASKKAGRFSGLASLAGISVPGEASGGLTDPSLYPAIVKSDLFLIDLLEESFEFETYRKKLPLIDFFLSFEERNIINRWFESLRRGKIPKGIKGIRRSNQRGFGQQKYRGDTTIIQLTNHQIRAMSMLRRAITVEAEEETGFIVVAVTMPEKQVSAELTQMVLEKLIDFAVNHQIKKEKTNLDFVEKRTAIAKGNFEDAQRVYAEFLDENQNVISARVKAREEQLKQELQITTSVYRGLATQLEQAKIALQEKTPVYSVFEPTVIPNQRDRPEYHLTLLGFIFIGFFLGFFWVCGVIVLGLLKKDDQGG